MQGLQVQQLVLQQKPRRQETADYVQGRFG